MALPGGFAGAAVLLGVTFGGVFSACVLPITSTLILPVTGVDAVVTFSVGLLGAVVVAFDSGGLPWGAVRAVGWVGGTAVLASLVVTTLVAGV